LVENFETSSDLQGSLSRIKRSDRKTKILSL